AIYSLIATVPWSCNVVVSASGTRWLQPFASPIRARVQEHGPRSQSPPLSPPTFCLGRNPHDMCASYLARLTLPAPCGTHTRGYHRQIAQSTAMLFSFRAGETNGASCQHRHAVAPHDQARLRRPYDGRKGPLHDEGEGIRGGLLGRQPALWLRWISLYGR